MGALRAGVSDVLGGVVIGGVRLGPCVGDDRQVVLAEPGDAAERGVGLAEQLAGPRIALGGLAVEYLTSTSAVDDCAVGLVGRVVRHGAHAQRRRAVVRVGVPTAVAAAGVGPLARGGPAEVVEVAAAAAAVSSR